MPRAEIERILSDLATRNERTLLPVLQRWFLFMQRQILRDLSTKFQKDITSELTDWEFIEGQGIRNIKPAALKIMQSGGNAAYKHLAIEGSFDILNVNAIKAADKFVAKLVVDVTAETKKGIRTFIQHGIKEGMSMPKIARELRPLVGLTDRQTDSIISFRRILEEKRPDLSVAQVDKKVIAQTNKVHRRRMENIARTETAGAQNIGYCQGLEEVGVEEAEFSISPNACAKICVPLNGKKYPISEAAWIIPGKTHPRCRCAMLPVVGDKTITGELKKPPSGLPLALPGIKPVILKLKIKPIDPPEEKIVLQKYGVEQMSEKLAMGISQKLRKLYPKELTIRNFGEMENAVLAYDSARTLAYIDKKIVGVISFNWDEVSEVVWISHTGTLTAPKGTGAELVRTAVDTAYGGRWGMALESTYGAIEFWLRLGFKKNKKVSYILEADFERVKQIKEALGSTGRVKEKIGVI